MRVHGIHPPRQGRAGGRDPGLNQLVRIGTHRHGEGYEPPSTISLLFRAPVVRDGTGVNVP